MNRRQGRGRGRRPMRGMMLRALTAVSAVSAAVLGGVCLAQYPLPPALAELAEPPPPPTTISGATGTGVDKSALAILKKTETTMLGLKSYRAECWMTLTREPKPAGTPGRVSRTMATLVAVKPNRMRYDSWEMTAQETKETTGTFVAWKRKSDTPTYTIVCDGKIKWLQFGDYYRTDKRTEPRRLITFDVEPWSGFYDAEGSPYSLTIVYQKEKGLLEVRRDGTEAVDSVLCDKVFTHIKTSFGGSGQEYYTTWYIGVKDGLVRRKVERVDFESSGYLVRDSTLRKIEVNSPVTNPKAVFAYVPPKGIALKKPEGAKEVPLLAKGVAAPDFTATDRDGKSVKLSDFRGKVVILDFWASWCPPCVESMPHNQAVVKKLQGENLLVVLLAVDNSEAREPFLKWVSAHKELDALTFVHADPKGVRIVDALYKVTGIPTQYIIDAKGIIRASSVGYDGRTGALENSVREALAIK